MLRRSDRGCTIRSARKQDIPPLMDLIGNLAAHQGMQAYLTVTAAKLENLLSSPAQPLLILVAEHAMDGLVGYITCHRAYSTFSGEAYGVVDNLFVVTKQRGLGVGQRLIGAVARHLQCEGIKRLDLTIQRENQKGLKFYQRLGFSVADETLLQLRGPDFQSLADTMSSN